MRDGGAPATGPGERTDALGMTASEMRRLAHLVADTVVDHFEAGHRGPAVSEVSPAALRATLGGPVPERPGDATSALRTAVDVVLRNMQHGDHPRYLARVPSPSSFAAVLGDWLATGHNAIATSWAGGSGTTVAELTALDWLRELLAMPDATEGVMASGGSLANLIALSTAAHETGGGVAYVTSQTHASVLRDLRLLAPSLQIEEVEVDERLRMSIASLRAAVARDRASGRPPAIVVASAGTTNTGAVDPLETLAGLARQADLWLHVDGAYGAPAALVPGTRPLFDGLERCDSLVVDPHKWLFQPYDSACVYVTRPGALARTFAMHPEYLADTRGAEGAVDLRDRTLELTRRARGLKLWLTFRIYGVERIREAIARGVGLAEHAEAVLRRDDRWQVVTPAQLGVVTFAWRGASAADHRDAAQALAAMGLAAVTSTSLVGRSVLRLCTINPLTTTGDLEATVGWLAERLGHDAEPTTATR